MTLSIIRSNWYNAVTLSSHNCDASRLDPDSICRSRISICIFCNVGHVGKNRSQIMVSDFLRSKLTSRVDEDYASHPSRFRCEQRTVSSNWHVSIGCIIALAFFPMALTIRREVSILPIYNRAAIILPIYGTS